MSENMKETFTVPIGPIHPALKEPVMLSFEVKGEKVIDAEVISGFNHRGMEWMARTRNPIQIIYLAERICGICSASHPFAYVTAYENAADIEVPERAQYIRMIVAELERIHSHILWAGIAAHEIGFDSILHYTWQVREKVMDALEAVTGNRVNYGTYMIGGVRRDITAEQVPYLKKCLEYYKGLYKKVESIFLDDPSVKARSDHIGILTNETAMKLSAAGPTTRASGVPKDVRVDEPYACYGDMDLDYILPDRIRNEVVGDVYDRIIVRLLELVQSIQIIEFCIENMPSGPILWDDDYGKMLIRLKRKSGEGIGRHEAPRGEAIHYIKLDGGEHIEGRESPRVWKARAPTYINHLSWPSMLIGEEIADLPLIIASIDPCMSCTDRVAVTDVDTNKTKILTAMDLHKMSVAKTRRLMK